MQGKSCHNLEAELPGRSPEIVLIGAHYDSVFGSPGSNDNGSGVAALLALARRFAGSQNGRTLRFVAFVNEEPQYFQSSQMGSFVYAGRCRERNDPIKAMISLETIGYYSNEAGSQSYPAPGSRFPLSAHRQLHCLCRKRGFALTTARCPGRRFASTPKSPPQGGALPAAIPGVGWSDQWSFWEHGYPGIMVTDTAPFRYPHYHAASDTPDKLDYDAMTRVVSALQPVIARLANPH